MPDKNFLIAHTCHYFFSYIENEGLDFEGVEKKQIRLQELENTITAKKSLESSNKNLKIARLAFFTSLIFSLTSIYISLQEGKKDVSGCVDLRVNEGFMGQKIS